MLNPGWTLAQLTHLAEVASGPTWTDAAERLGITQSALSQSLAELERRLGMELFERRGRRRVLTAPGQQVLNEAERLLAVATDLDRTATALASGATGDLRVGMIDTAALRVLPSAIRSFRSEHANVALHLVVEASGELTDRVLGGDLDLAVIVRPPQPAHDLEITLLVEEPLLLFAPPGTPTTPPERWGPWAMFPARSTTRGIIERALADRGADPRVVTESPNPEVLRQVVGLGLGWAVLPRSEASVGDGILTPYRRSAIARRDLVVIRRGAAPLDPRAETFVDLARSSALASTGAASRSHR